MKNIRVWSMALLVLLTAALVGAQTPIGTAITYQGFLRHDGLPGSGLYDLRFQLFDDANGGTPLAEQVHCGVDVDDGIFTTLLDFGAAFDDEGRWLELGVAAAGPCDGSTAYDTLAPRQRITATPNALHATNADLLGGLSATDFLRDGSPITGDLEIQGSLVVSSQGIRFADGSVQTTAGTGSDLTQNIALNGNWLSGDGDDEGVTVDADGNVRMGSLHARRETDTGWDLGVVDASAFVGTHLSTFAVNDQTIVASYLDATNADLRFVRTDDGGDSWFGRAVDTSGIVGEYTSIFALDQDTLLISYFRANNPQQVRLARSSDGGVTWTTSVVNTANDNNQSTTIHALDADTIFIGYQNSGLQLATTGNGGATWGFSTIDPAARGSNALIAVSETTILATYVAGTSLWFAKTENGGLSWQAQVIGNSASSFDISFSVADPLTMAVSYFRSSPQSLRVAKTTDGGDTWSDSVVDNVGTFSSIVAFDSNEMAVAYNDASQRDLEFARTQDGGSSWQRTTIDANGTAGLWPQLTPVRQDQLLITYYEDNAKTLRFARSRDTVERIGVGTSAPTSALQVKGYLQLGLTGGRPPFDQCNELSEVGRLKANPDGTLYLCAQQGWVMK